MADYRRILVPIELDRKGEMTVRRALGMAQAMGGQLVVVSPVYYQTGFESDHVPFMTPQQLLRQTAGMMQQQLDELLLRAGAGEAQGRILVGKPAKIIPAFARQWRPELIVLGEGRSYGLRKALRLPGDQQTDWDILTVRTGSLTGLGGLWRWVMNPS